MQKTSITIRGIEFGNGIPKICVPVVARTQEDMIAQTKRILGKKPDCMELRMDWLEDMPEQDKIIDLLRKLRILVGDMVLLFTFRTKREGGEAAITSEAYETLCRNVCRCGYIDLIDVEAYMKDGLLAEVSNTAHENQVYVVASNHDFEKTPSEEEIVRRLQFMDVSGADIPKIAVMPKQERDVITLLSATLRYWELGGKKPVITMSMGGCGMISRLAGEMFGSAITFAAAEQASAPGQIPLDEVRRILYTIHEYR